MYLKKGKDAQTLINRKEISNELISYSCSSLINRGQNLQSPYCVTATMQNKFYVNPHVLSSPWYAGPQHTTAMDSLNLQ